FCPTGSGRANVGERRLFELKALVRLGGIAAAEDFALGFAVRGANDVGVDRESIALVAVREVCGENELRKIASRIGLLKRYDFAKGYASARLQTGDPQQSPWQQFVNFAI